MIADDLLSSINAGFGAEVQLAFREYANGNKEYREVHVARLLSRLQDLVAAKSEALQAINDNRQLFS